MAFFTSPETKITFASWGYDSAEHIFLRKAHILQTDYRIWSLYYLESVAVLPGSFACGVYSCLYLHVPQICRVCEGVGQHTTCTSRRDSNGFGTVLQLPFVFRLDKARRTTRLKQLLSLRVSQMGSAKIALVSLFTKTSSHPNVLCCLYALPPESHRVFCFFGMLHLFEVCFPSGACLAPRKDTSVVAQNR